MPPDINWNESAPPTTESAGLGAQPFQSHKTGLRTGLDAEHPWPTSGLGAGVHRLGSARAYYGPQSLVSSTGTDGRLQVTSDTSRLFHVGSAGTMFLGGSAVISAGSQPVGGQRFYWAEEFGRQINNAGNTIITFPNSGFSGIPFVFLSLFTDGGPALGPNLNAHCAAITKTSATINGAYNGAQWPSSIVTIMWRSIGTRTF